MRNDDFSTRMKQIFPAKDGFSARRIPGLESPFQLLFSDAHQLAIHGIDLDRAKREEPDAGFFRVKTAQADGLGIRLVHLWEDVFTRQNELVLARLGAMLGRNRTVHGRQCTVRRIDKKTADEFLSCFHLQFSAAARYRYGLFHRDELLAVATFSSGRIFNKDQPDKRSFELVRFATVPGITVNGGLSKLIRAFVLEVKPADIMTYADRDWSAGRGYHKLGFMLEKETPPQAFFIRPDEMIRYYPHRLPAALQRGFAASGRAGMDEFLHDEGYFRIHNAGNLKFRLRF